jgi:hypothetical protein
MTMTPSVGQQQQQPTEPSKKRSFELEARYSIGKMEKGVLLNVSERVQRFQKSRVQKGQREGRGVMGPMPIVQPAGTILATSLPLWTLLH